MSFSSFFGFRKKDTPQQNPDQPIVKKESSYGSFTPQPTPTNTKENTKEKSQFRSRFSFGTKNPPKEEDKISKEKLLAPEETSSKKLGPTRRYGT